MLISDDERAKTFVFSYIFSTVEFLTKKELNTALLLDISAIELEDDFSTRISWTPATKTAEGKKAAAAASVSKWKTWQKHVQS